MVQLVEPTGAALWRPEQSGARVPGINDEQA